MLSGPKMFVSGGERQSECEWGEKRRRELLFMNGSRGSCTVRAGFSAMLSEFDEMILETYQLTSKV